MAIFTDTFIEAHFIDYKKTQIEVYYKGDGGGTVAHHVPVVWSHPDFKDLLKIVTLESLEKKWDKSIRGPDLEEREKIKEDLIKKYAKAELEKELEEDLSEKVIKWLELNNDNQKNLFPFKVSMLQKDYVKSSSKEIKNKINKAKNIFTVMAAVGEALDGK